MIHVSIKVSDLYLFGYFHNTEEEVTMKKNKETTNAVVKRKSRPALTPEARENQMIALAVDLAEQQLRDGTASSQVITHYLKLGSTKERLEQEILKEQRELMKAKTDALQSAQDVKELYSKALDAMRLYSGNQSAPTGDDIYDEDL